MKQCATQHAFKRSDDARMTLQKIKIASFNQKFIFLNRFLSNNYRENSKMKHSMIEKFE